MSIIRAKRRTNFTVVSNCVYADDVLSFRAMGLLGYLLAKPDDWEVSVHQLAKATKNTKRPMGADAIRETLNELIEAGFVRRKKRYTGEMDYFVFDEPQAITADDQTGILPNREKAKQGKSQTGILPNREKPDVLINTERPYQELKKDYQELSCGAPETGVEDGDCDFASEAAPDSDFADDFSDGLVGNLPAETVKAETVQTVLPADTLKPAKPENQTAANRAVWVAYRQAYLDRYGVEPLRNAKVNGQIAQFVRMVGASDAPHLAAYYLRHNNGFFVQRRHDFGLLLQSAQQIRTDWLRGEQMTGTAARQAENTQSNLETAKRVLAARAARRQQGESA